jgi:transcriptional regulator with XRE-family HTH domain
VTLGQRLKRFRHARGYTQKELAALTRVRQALISELETGRKHDTLGRTLQRLAEGLGITIERLLGEESTHPDPRAAPHLVAAGEPGGGGKWHCTRWNVSHQSSGYVPPLHIFLCSAPTRLP